MHILFYPWPPLKQEKRKKERNLQKKERKRGAKSLELYIFIVFAFMLACNFSISRKITVFSPGFFFCYRKPLHLRLHRQLPFLWHLWKLLALCFRVSAMATSEFILALYFVEEKKWPQRTSFLFFFALL